ncbi:MAG: P-II family nitrogen regulator [Arthrobacter sp.]|jgi:nitrogen regulatory protein P-II 1|nr:P-II family nitrogen regulator [Arthrobacter sp.]
MYLITAIIRPERLDAAREALQAAGVAGLTVSEAAGFGRQRGHVQVYRGAEYAVDLLPKVRLEVIADDHTAPGLVDVLVAAANTGHAGDGKVWLHRLDDVVRVSTGERGPGAV